MKIPQDLSDNDGDIDIEPLLDAIESLWNALIEAGVRECPACGLYEGHGADCVIAAVGEYRDSGS